MGSSMSTNFVDYSSLDDTPWYLQNRVDPTTLVVLGGMGFGAVVVMSILFALIGGLVYVEMIQPKKNDKK